MFCGGESLRSLLGCLVTAWLALAGPRLLHAAPTANGLLLLDGPPAVFAQEMIEPLDRERLEIEFQDSGAGVPNIQWPFRVSENSMTHEMLPQPDALRQFNNNNHFRRPESEKRGSYMNLCSFKICNMGKRKYPYN